MRFEKFTFGSIQIDGSTYDHDIVVDRGEVRKRKKSQCIVPPDRMKSARES